MHRAARYAMVAVVVVALLSVAAHEAMARSGPVDPESCGTGLLSVDLLEEDRDLDADVEIRDYEALAADERRAFDRARTSTDPVVVDPSLLVESNLTETFTADGHSFPVAAVVRHEGENYNVHPRFENCPAVAGVPRQANVLVYMFAAIYRVFSPLYLPGAALLVVLGAYRRVDDWLRFG